MARQKGIRHGWNFPLDRLSWYEQQQKRREAVILAQFPFKTGDRVDIVSMQWKTLETGKLVGFRVIENHAIYCNIRLDNGVTTFGIYPRSIRKACTDLVLWQPQAIVLWQPQIVFQPDKKTTLSIVPKPEVEQEGQVAA